MGLNYCHSRLSPYSKQTIIKWSMETIISVKEARKLLGKEESSKLSDTQVEELIIQLNFLAEYALDSYKKSKL